MDLDKITFSEIPKRRFGDQMELRMGLSFEEQKYLNMADNRVFRRKQIEDLKSWITADDYSKQSSKILFKVIFENILKIR